MENQLIEQPQVTSDQASDTEPLSVSDLLAARLQRLREPWPSDEAIARMEAEEEPKRRKGIVSNMIEQAGERFRSYTLASWQALGPKQREVKDAAQEWGRTFPERQQAGNGLVLYGPVGTGKDHLAFSVVAAAVLKHGFTAGFRNGRELMAEYRDRIGADKPEAGLMDALTWQHVLILSDPLPVKGELTDFQADVLYRLVDGRVAAGLLTVCTLNVANDAEADRRLGAATWDRLCDRAWKLACFWDSYRKPSREIAP